MIALVYRPLYQWVDIALQSWLGAGLTASQCVTVSDRTHELPSTQLVRPSEGDRRTGERQ
jgi:hypothetical protein